MSSINLNAHVEMRNGRLVVVYEIDALTDALALCVDVLRPADAPKLTQRLLNIATAAMVSAMVAQKKPQSPALQDAITCAQDYLHDLIPDEDESDDE